MNPQSSVSRPSPKLSIIRTLMKLGYKVPGRRTLKLYSLCEQVRKYYAQVPQSVIIDDLDSNLKIQVDLSEHIGSKIFWQGSYSQNELDVLKNHLAVDDTFIDIGANIGLFTLFAAKRLHSGQVYAFEPASVLFKRLSTNVEANGFQQVHLFRLGLSDRDSEMKIYFPIESDNHGTFNDGMASLFSEKEGWRAEEVVCLKTLDSFVQQQQLQRIDFVKIDIEGAELMALRGAKETLKTFRPKILIEVNEEACERAGYQGIDILKYLRQFGYNFYFINERGSLAPCNQENLSRWQNLLCLPTN